jgi:hypothetical protein
VTFAETFAKEWIDAWNAHDLERIFAHYDDNFVFSSPLIRERGFDANGVLHGKNATRPYWSRGLAATPPIQFELLGVYAGADCVSIHYRSVGRALVCETLFFGANGKVTRAAAAYRKLPDQG